MINQEFSVRLKSALFNLMQQKTNVNTETILIQTYGEFISQLNSSASLHFINLKPMRRNTLFAFTPGLIFIVIDVLFGGRGRLPDFKEKVCTPIERRITELLLKLILQNYKDAWLHLCPLELNCITQETSYTGFRDNEIIIISPFEVIFEKIKEKFFIIFSQSDLGPLREKLSQSLPEDICQDQIQWQQKLVRQLQNAKLELIVHFAELPLCFSKVMTLQQGEVLLIQRPEQLTAYIDNIPILTGSYGSLNGKYALKVECLFNRNINQLNNKDITYE